MLTSHSTACLVEATVIGNMQMIDQGEHDDKKDPGHAGGVTHLKGAEESVVDQAVIGGDIGVEGVAAVNEQRAAEDSGKVKYHGEKDGGRDEG